MAIQDTAGAAQIPSTSEQLRQIRSGSSSPHTRIREFRKLRGLTLLQLAEKIGTTPQTVQRLETANMTVSTDWLGKIAQALLVEPADLISTRAERDIQIIGRFDERGRIIVREHETQTFFHMDVAVEDPVAAQIDVSIGPFEAGTLLVANRLRNEDLDNAHGHDCLVAIDSGAVLLRRVIRGRSNGWTLVSHGNGGEIQYDRTLAWAARIIMAIRYF